MAPNRKRDKFKALFRHKTPQLEPRPPESTNIPLPVTRQKAFTKSKKFEKDIAILSATYILDQNPYLKTLIYIIIVMHDKDEEGQLTDILETCARFSVQLAYAIEAHRTEATEAITAFIKTVEKVNKGNDQSSYPSRSMVDDEIVKIKSSHPFLRDYDIGSSEGLSKLLGVAIGASIAVLQVVKEASALVPVPGVQPLIGGVVTLLKAVAQTRSNYNDMREIAATAGEFAVSCAVVCSDRTTEPSNELKRSLNIFTKKLERIAKECDEFSKLHPFWRYLQQNAQNNDLIAIKERLKTAIEVFQNESHVNIQLDISDLSRKFDHTMLNSLPSHPRYTHNEYLHASRDDVIQYISSWIDEPNEFVLWLHGAAGLGKSTLSQQLVNLLKSDDRLAGGVFLTHLTMDHPATVIQMISKQIGEMHPRASSSIAEAARKHNGPHGALMDYFTSYIVDPVRRLKYSYQLIIIIDGLDEWPNRESFLAELEHIPSPSPLKFILTSRPNHSIERVLNKIPLVRPYSLPPVSQETVERYFNCHFDSDKIDWRGRKPDELTISRLATQAHGLLIWAATVRSLVSYEFDQRYPHVILDQILSSEEKVGTRSGEQLEGLYRNAIETLFPESAMREQLQYFLGGITVLQEALPVRDFARLLNMSDRPVAEIQRRLVAFRTRGSFVSNIVPPAIQQFHISFLEFVQPISSKHNGQSIATSSLNAHSLLGNECLKIVFSDLFTSHRGQSCNYSELLEVERYAVKFWPLHVLNGSPRPLSAISSTATTLGSTLLNISDVAMQRWGTLFLPCVATRFQDGCDSLDNISGSSLPYKLAMIIGKEDVTTLLYRIYCLEIAVRLQPIDVDTWRALGETYHMLYEHGRYNKNLDEEIIAFRQALELVSQTTTSVAIDIVGPANADTQGSIFSWLACALQTRFAQRSIAEDLDEAISLHREALVLLQAPHPLHTASLNNLANSFQTRFEQRGASNDLDEAISLHREALVLLPAPHPDRSTSLNNLANSLRTRFEQSGDSDDLDDAISLHREALNLRPAPHPHRSMSLNNLANSLRTRFEQWGDPDDLDNAIALHREALILLSAPHPDHFASLNNLANALQTRFEDPATSNDLDEAISLYREALVLLPAPHPFRSASLNNLANALRIHFKQRGISNNLEESISLHREALALRPAPHPDRLKSLNNLAHSLETRFQQRGDFNDLDEAIHLRREGLVHLPAPHPDRYMSLRNLTTALQTRFKQRGASNDLDEATSLHQEALTLQPAPKLLLVSNRYIPQQIRFTEASGSPYFENGTGLGF